MLGCWSGGRVYPVKAKEVAPIIGACVNCSSCVSSRVVGIVDDTSRYLSRGLGVSIETMSS